MEGAEESFKLSLGINGPARDLVQNNNGGGEAADGDDLQLCLGLSTNGKFGIDPGSRKLKRSFSNLNGGESSSAVAREVAVDSHALLGRAHSLPLEMEEMRQRKELQSLRRMEAMKKRMEKKKNVKMAKSGSKDDSSEGDSNGNGNSLVGSSSLGSYKSGSSVFSDLQSQQHTEVVVRKAKVEVKQEPVEKPAETITKRDRTETPKSPLLDMPYVSTRGDVHTRIEGFLYRYKTGEAIKIVCVCHGLFLSPAEFVKHGGGGDVANPLQHIVVNESALFG